MFGVGSSSEERIVKLKNHNESQTKKEEYKSRFFFILLCVLSSGTYVHNVTESVAMNRDERCAMQGR